MKKHVLLLSLSIFFLTSSAQKYYVYVASESEDEVSLVSFDGQEVKRESVISVGYIPKETEGPHGLAMGLQGKYWYLTMAHGNPFGYVYKYSTETNELVGQTTVGMFPASMQMSKLTGMLYIVNFNLHGDMVPSSVSVVEPNSMTEIKRITTGAMPHGSRITPDGRWHYSLAMMSGDLFEIDAVNMQISRTLNLDLASGFMNENEVQAMKATDHSSHSEDMPSSVVKPTWVIPHPSERKAYVAGNGCSELFEINLKDWKVERRFKGGKGPYNVEITPDGSKMVTTYKSDGTTGIWDLKTGQELARVENTRKVSHGIAITPDSQYAFVTVEGIGGEPGTVDVIDLTSLKKVGHADVGKQAGGITFWKVED